MVRESQLPHMEALVPDVGCRGEERREAHWERQVGPMCVTRGPLSNAVGSALPVEGSGAFFQVSRKQILHHVLVEYVRIRPLDSVGLVTGQKTLAETDRRWSGQGRACKTACNLSHHHHVPTKA